MNAVFVLLRRIAYAGSVEEAEDEQGLAHVAEHVAFLRDIIASLH